jgi:ribosomal protein S18 acetylase RimI-like enzyme
MHFRYKKIEYTDLPFIQRLFEHKAYKEIFFEDKTTLSDWQKRFSKINMFQIIYHHKEPIGVIDLKSDKETVHILLLALTYPTRNKGYGSKILKDIHMSYPNKRILVDVMKSNQEALMFYLKKGFVAYNEYEEFYEEQSKSHKYIALEKIQVSLYQDQFKDAFINISIDEKDQDYVASLQNILYKHIKDKEHTKLYIATYQNKVIGTILIRFDHDYHNAFIWQMIITKESQNKGLGSAFLYCMKQTLKEYYKEYTITTTIKDQNKRSIHFFKKNGFILHSTVPSEEESNYILK